MFHVDTDKDGVIKFKEWSEFLLFSPKSNNIGQIYSFYSNIIHQSDSGDQVILPEGIYFHIHNSGEGYGTA